MYFCVTWLSDGWRCWGAPISWYYGSLVVIVGFSTRALWETIDSICGGGFNTTSNIMVSCNMGCGCLGHRGGGGFVVVDGRVTVG